jgi:hypothetical protein
MTPAWILDVLAAVMLVVAAVSAARLVAARPWRPGSVVIDTDVAHLLMAIAMAGMLTSSLRTLPDTAWAVVFGLMTAWFTVRVALDARSNGVRALAGGHCAPHLVHSGAMLYMFLALTTPAAAAGMSGMAGMPVGPGPMMTLSYPTLAFVFALILGGYSVWDLDRLSGRWPSLRTARVSLAGVPVVGVPVVGVPVVGVPVVGVPAVGVPVVGGAALGVPAMAAAEPGSAAVPGAQPAAAAPDVGYRSGTADNQAVPASEDAGGQNTAGVAGLLLSPGVTVGCRIALGVVMAFILIVAI